MLELSLNILDIVENSTRAGAKNVFITIVEDSSRDELMIKVEDDGAGMSEEALNKAVDPFYTTKEVRRVGLGLPMLAEAAQRSGGKFILESAEKIGTRVVAVFVFSNIDRQPLGDMAGTMSVLIAGNPLVDFIYRHIRNDREYILDTRQIKKEIDGVPINHVDILKLIRANVEEGLKEIGAEA